MQLRRPFVFALAGSFLDPKLELFQLLLLGAHVRDDFFLLLPARLQGVRFFLDVRQLLLECLQAFARVGIVLALQRLPLDFQLCGSSLKLVDFRGHRVDLDAQRSCRFVNQIDCLVRQEPVRDVAVRQCRRRHDGRVLDADTVMDFIFLA